MRMARSRSMLGLISSGSTVMTPKNPGPIPLPRLHLVLAGVQHALIGGYAVNAWLPPRLTGDIDLTIAADRAGFERLAERLAVEGLTRTKEQGAGAPSGPDFQRFMSRDRRIVVEIQAAKTPFQHEVIRRAQPLPAGLRVATPEDLIVLKLIADRGKDAEDLQGLCGLSGLDWEHVKRWALVWGVQDRLLRYRKVHE